MDEQSPDRIPGPRRAAREAERARKELDSMRRELALRKGGVPLDQKVGRLFARTYNGEVTKEAVAAAWGEIAAELAPKPPPVQLDEYGEVVEPEAPGIAFTASELASTDERNTLASAGSGISRSLASPDPRAIAEQRFLDHVEDGHGTEAAGLGIMFDTLVEAAKKGDKRVIVPGFSL